MTQETVLIDRVRVGVRLRGINEDQVVKLATSIAEVGLLNPITVIAREVIEGGNAVPGYGVVAGAHRLEAVRRLGWDTIPAQVVDLPAMKVWLAEIDENLAGPMLTRAERAIFTKRRKEIYEQIHPETRSVNERGGPGRGKTTDNLSAVLTPAFTAETADRTGVDERTIRRDAARGEGIAEDVLEMIVGTGLDVGVELDALTKLPPEEQRKLAEQAAADQPVTARPGKTPRVRKQRKPRETKPRRVRADRGATAALAQQMDEAAAILVDLMVEHIPTKDWPTVDSTLSGITLPRLIKAWRSSTQDGAAGSTTNHRGVIQ